MTSLKNLFLLDPAVHFLNHGSFGATPRPVFEEYQRWQARLERQPVLFLGREFDGLLLEARRALGEFIHAAADDLVFVPNATHAVNIVARSLPLAPGDEILISEHEYGACEFAWEAVCRKSGARLVRQPLALPLRDEAEAAEAFWAGVTPRTRVIFLSHITSPTALRLPVEILCQRARQSGIWTVIDGAHALGQIPLDMAAIGADFYTSNAHKWLCAPKGAAFFYARREVQALIEPLVVSWGYHAPLSSGSQFVDYLQWTGTADPAAYLSVPAAIQFQQENDWERVRAACKELLTDALLRLNRLTGLEPLCPLPSAFYTQMACAPLPAESDLAALKARLYDEFQVEVPLIDWQGRKLMRISVQAYNTQADLEALLSGVGECLP
ncbi:MAG: aminotransferase class V-fold PLP-dependent enzyme [Anaerolineales bacterium]